MKSRLVKLSVLLTLSLAALAACNDAIFATIDTEKKTATNTLSQTISVFDVAVPATGTYIVAAGAIFKGVLSGTTVNWTPNSTDTSRPWNPSGMLCNAMTYLAGTDTLWGNFLTQSGATALYQSSSGGAASPYSFASSTAVSDPLLNGKQVTMITTANGNLFVSATADTTNYELDYNVAGAGPWVGPAITATTYGFVGVAWDGANYWTASGATLYKSNSLPTFTGAASVTTSSGAVTLGTVNGVFANSGVVIVSTRTNGVFYSTNSGLLWTQVQPDHQGTVTVSYLSAAGPYAPGYYLVGSDGYGYYVLNTGSATLSRYGDSTTALYLGSVSRIVLDIPNSIVLMGTNSKGLWRTVYDNVGGNIPASGQSWINE